MPSCESVLKTSKVNSSYRANQVLGWLDSTKTTHANFRAATSRHDKWKTRKPKSKTAYSCPLAYSLPLPRLFHFLILGLKSSSLMSIPASDMPDSDTQITQSNTMNIMGLTHELDGRYKIHSTHVGNRMPGNVSISCPSPRCLDQYLTTLVQSWRCGIPFASSFVTSATADQHHHCCPFAHFSIRR